MRKVKNILGSIKNNIYEMKLKVRSVNVSSETKNKEILRPKIMLYEMQGITQTINN